MINQKNRKLTRFTVTGADPSMVPVPEAINGVTIDSANGTNLKFDGKVNDNLLHPFAYVWDNTNKEGRQILQVNADNRGCSLYEAFSNDVTGLDLYLVPNGTYTEVSIASDNVAATVDGVAVDPSLPFTARNEAGLEPISVDPNGNTLTVNIIE